jgi:hypothetical protein
MSAATLNINPPSPFRRLVAAFGIALVLLLGVAAVNPALHEHLHGADTADTHATTDTCAVVLFGTGFTLALGAIALSAPRPARRELIIGKLVELALASPRYLHPPERGPPVKQ